MYRIESSVAGNFSSTTASVPLVVFDPAASTTGSGSVPTALLPPNDSATLDFNLKYEPNATRPSGTLHVTRGLPAASPPAPAASPSAPTTTLTPGTTLTPTTPALSPTPAPTPATAAPVAPAPCQGTAADPNGSIDFQATGFDWLAITGSSAQFQGVGTINGCGRYLVAGTATQGAAPATDTFEVHIWDATHSFDAPLLLVTGTLSTGQIKIVR